MVAAVCFPEVDTENECPHVTLFNKEWKAVDSNSLLEAIAKHPETSEIYEGLRAGKQVEAGEVQVQIDRKSVV